MKIAKTIREVQEVCQDRLRENRRVICVDDGTGNTTEFIVRRKSDGSLCLELLGPHQISTLVVFQRPDGIELRNNREIIRNDGQR